MYGQKFGRKLVKPLKVEKNRNGHKRNRSLALLEDCEEFIDLDDREYSENFQKRKKKIGQIYGSRDAV